MTGWLRFLSIAEPGEKPIHELNELRPQPQATAKSEAKSNQGYYILRTAKERTQKVIHKETPMKVIFEAIFGWLDLVINVIKPAIDEIMENPILRLMTISATIGGTFGTIKRIWRKLQEP